MNDVVLNTPVDYAAGAPDSYRCQKCDVFGVKLWRDYSSFLDNQRLLCLACACADQDELCEPTEDGKSLYTGKTYHLYRMPYDKPGWFTGYDPAKGSPEGAVEFKTQRERCDQVGSMVPAVPTEDGMTYWGYTSVPQSGVDWWHRLPYTASGEAPRPAQST